MPFFNIFIKDIPSRIDLQKALDHNQIPIGLLKSYELVEYRGWARMKLGSYNGAIEIFVDYVTSQYIPVGREQIGDRGIVITLNYADDAMSSCLAAGLASTMAKSYGALVYAGQFLSSKQLLITFNELLTRARFEARQTPHKLLLDALSARLPHFAKKGNYFFYLPLGHSVRGFFLAPSKGTFEVRLLLWPLVAYSDRLHVSHAPEKLGIPNCYGNLYKPPASQMYWRYEPDCADVLVDFAYNKMEPYFDAIADQAALAAELFEQFHDSRQIYELEKTGMACAAAGHYENALKIFDRFHYAISDTRRYEYIVDMEQRCDTIASFVKENRIEELDAQLAKFKAHTLRKYGLAGVAKRGR